MSSRMPTIGAVLRDGEPPLVVARHREQRREDEVVSVDRDHVEMADVAHRRVERQPPQHRRLRQVHAGDHADALAVAHEERVVVALRMRWPASSMVAAAVDEHGGAMARVAHACAQHLVHALGLLAADEARQLVGDLGVEEGGEAGIAADQIEHQRLRREVAQGLLGGDEVAAGRAVHQRARIEAVLRPEHRLDLVVLAVARPRPRP